MAEANGVGQIRKFHGAARAYFRIASPATRAWDKHQIDMYTVDEVEKAVLESNLPPPPLGGEEPQKWVAVVALSAQQAAAAAAEEAVLYGKVFWRRILQIHGNNRTWEEEQLRRLQRILSSDSFQEHTGICRESKAQSKVESKPPVKQLSARPNLTGGSGLDSRETGKNGLPGTSTSRSPTKVVVQQPRADLTTLQVAHVGGTLGLEDIVVADETGSMASSWCGSHVGLDVAKVVSAALLQVGLNHNEGKGKELMEVLKRSMNSRAAPSSCQSQSFSMVGMRHVTTPAIQPAHDPPSHDPPSQTPSAVTPSVPNMLLSMAMGGCSTQDAWSGTEQPPPCSTDMVGSGPAVIGEAIHAAPAITCAAQAAAPSKATRQPAEPCELGDVAALDQRPMDESAGDQPEDGDEGSEVDELGDVAALDQRPMDESAGDQPEDGDEGSEVDTVYFDSLPRTLASGVIRFNDHTITPPVHDASALKNVSVEDVQVDDELREELDAFFDGHALNMETVRTCWASHRAIVIRYTGRSKDGLTNNQIVHAAACKHAFPLEHRPQTRLCLDRSRLSHARSHRPCCRDHAPTCARRRSSRRVVPCEENLRDVDESNRCVRSARPRSPPSRLYP